MKNNWFECKVKYTSIDDSGKQKVITETYLVDAVSFTETEARIHEELEYIAGDDLIVHAISRSNISEVFTNDNGDRWFKSKVVFVDIDEYSGAEKKSIEYMLLQANTVKDAYEFLLLCLNDMLVPFETPSVSESNIVDVFSYFDAERPRVVTESKQSIEKVDCESYDANKEYSVGDKVLFRGEECVITKNGINATFRKI